MKKLVAERIRLLRLSNNLSQENVADELGISIGAYSNIERGITDITITRADQLARIFKVSIIDLVNRDKAASDFINDPLNEYGYANKEDLNELSRTVAELSIQIKEIKREIHLNNPLKR
jgi:transcriptional regulator with XRE-family HTH domain